MNVSYFLSYSALFLFRVRLYTMPLPFLVRLSPFSLSRMILRLEHKGLECCVWTVSNLVWTFCSTGDHWRGQVPIFLCLLIFVPGTSIGWVPDYHVYTHVTVGEVWRPGRSHFVRFLSWIESSDSTVNSTGTCIIRVTDRSRSGVSFDKEKAGTNTLLEHKIHKKGRQKG